MKVLVAFESRSGYTRRVAQSIAAAARGLGAEAVIKPVAEIQPADVQAADALFLGTWVQGFVLFGVRPAGVKEWVPALPPLTGKPVGVYCSYRYNPRGSLQTLSALLAGRGAVVKARQAFQRDRPSDGADSFVRQVLESAGQ